MKLSVIIPAYNEELIFQNTAQTLLDALDNMQSRGVFDTYELIFVSDGSSDATPALIAEADRQYPQIKGCVYNPNYGKGHAVRTGILASDGDIVLYTDCDLAYGTDVIESAVRQMNETGADVLIGSRAIHPEGYDGYTPLRKIASVLYLRILGIAAGFHQSDSQAGFKALRGDIGRKIFVRCEIDRFAFDLEMLMRAQKEGCSITELPVKVINHRESSIHLVRDSIRMLRDIIKIKKSMKS